ncbi:MAG TPA: hypothetical protein VH044_04970 [Polyangiaceae bacterium]|jgi:hypothetical protein|nr:hypothetical protein [Polyangiaceae bacterium]
MSFVIGSLLFIAVVGALDARLPWPRPSSRARRSHRDGEVRS